MGRGTSTGDRLALRPVPLDETAPADIMWDYVRAADLGERGETLFRLRLVEGLTLRECGARLGLTRERVRQLESDILGRVAAQVPRDVMPLLSEVYRRQIKARAGQA